MAVVGAAAGMIAGLLGVGGGIIMVPALTLVLPAVGVRPELSMHLAVATSLAVIIVTGSASARAHYRRGSVDVVRVGHWAIFVAAGAAGGALAARFLDGNFLRFAFGLLALFVASRLLFERQRSVRVRAIGRGAQRLIVGVIGMLSAWLGIGGGTMMVALLRSTGLAMHQAVGTGALLGVVVAIPGTLGFIASGWTVPDRPDHTLGYVYWPAALVLALGAFLMAPVGARLAHRLPQALLQRVFALFLAAAGTRMLWKAISLS